MQVWEVGEGFALSAGGFRSSTQSPLGRIADSAWLPLPQPVGHGAVTALLLHPGVISLLDVAQSRSDRTTYRARSEALRHALIASEGSSTHAQQQLVDVNGGGDTENANQDEDQDNSVGTRLSMAAGPACASALLLAPARLALLRLIIQAGS